jgi:hypothetical protein
MAQYAVSAPATFEISALVSVCGLLVVAALTKGGYSLWAAGGMICLYVLYSAVRGTVPKTRYESGFWPLGHRG